MESIALKLILITVLAFVANEINIVTLAQQKLKAIKSFSASPGKHFQKFYQSLFVHYLKSNR